MSIEVKKTIIIAASMVIAAVIGLVIIKVCNKNGKLKSDYDERQQIMIGKGYKWAMIVSWVLLAIFMALDMGGIVLPVADSFMFYTVIFVSLLVYSSCCLWTDAFFGLNNNRRMYAIVFFMFSLLFVGMTVAVVKADILVVDGILTANAIDIEGAVICAILSVELLVKNMIEKNKKDDEEDEDEES